MLEALWRRLGLVEIVGEIVGQRRLSFPLERALYVMVANRLCAPGSKLYCYEQWLQQDVRISGAERLQLEHLYRAMEVLEAHEEALEQALCDRLLEQVEVDVELIFYDTTSLHFEIDQADQGEGDPPEISGSAAAGARRYPPPRRRGKSKNGRDDAPQIVVGLAVTRDGFPIRHWVFPGNAVDVSTVKRVKADLKAWRLGRCVFVGDAGMVSEENLERLRRSGERYILGAPIRAGTEVAIKARSNRSPSRARKRLSD